MNIKLNQKGQSLLEVVVAVGVIVTSLFAVWSLFLSNYNDEREARQRMVGFNLAREGIEAVKNIRDSNWLKSYENQTCGGPAICRWDSGLAGDGTAVIQNLTADGDLALDFSINNINDNGARLYISPAGFYDHNDVSGAVNSPYRRLITIKNICCADADGDFVCDNFDIFNINNAGEPCDAAGQLKAGLDVSSLVVWLVQGGTRQVIAQDQLFDWR